MPHTADRTSDLIARRPTIQNNNSNSNQANHCPAELHVELEAASRMLIHGETIDLICLVKASNHLAMANRQGPVQIYDASNLTQQNQ